jgi:hypothetical protein
MQERRSKMMMLLLVMIGVLAIILSITLFTNATSYRDGANLTAYIEPDRSFYLENGIWKTADFNQSLSPQRVQVGNIPPNTQTALDQEQEY